MGVAFLMSKQPFIKIEVYVPELEKAINNLADALRVDPSKVNSIISFATNFTEPSESESVESVPTEEKTVSIENIREVMVRLSKQGKQNEVKALLSKYTTENSLSKVKESDYNALYKEVLAL
jgi:hypothetical protein